MSRSSPDGRSAKFEAQIGFAPAAGAEAAKAHAQEQAAQAPAEAEAEAESEAPAAAEKAKKAGARATSWRNKWKSSQLLACQQWPPPELPGATMSTCVKQNHKLLAPLQVAEAAAAAENIDMASTLAAAAAARSCEKSPPLQRFHTGRLQACTEKAALAYKKQNNDPKLVTTRNCVSVLVDRPKGEDEEIKEERVEVEGGETEEVDGLNSRRRKCLAPNVKLAAQPVRAKVRSCNECDCCRSAMALHSVVECRYHLLKRKSTCPESEDESSEEDEPHKAASWRSIQGQEEAKTSSWSHKSKTRTTRQATQCSNNQMILVKLAQLVFIYIITSSVFLPAVSTNYWPLRKHHNSNNNNQQQQHEQAAHQQQQLLASGAEIGVQPALRSRQLMIGQHYNNFSSIVPYSIVQDSDYAGSMQEDQLLEEQQPASFEHLHHHHRHEHGQEQQQVVISAQGGEQHQHLADTQSDTSRPEGSLRPRALLPLESNRLILPQMQQIKSRFNQGCVGGTKCQFFAFCWMSGGSLGASCGLLMTCCVTPSRQEIQPGFYGPVVNDPYCGRSTSKINRIVGGTDASFGQFPWQAFVQVGGSRCGGALISSRHVVTAGHCVARSQHSPSSIKVTLGDYILNSDIESIPHEVFSVVEVLLHPNFRFTPQADRYDVAVLELDRTASYKDNIKPICLPQKDATFVGRAAYVAGWGALQAGSKLRPKVLQHVAVPVIENHVCESWHRRKGIDIRIYDEMMCAGYEVGQRDACQGDSGGPLMLNQFGVWYLVGIVSAGYSCAKQYQPGIYHRVSSSSDWISSNVYQQGSNK